MKTATRALLVCLSPVVVLALVVVLGLGALRYEIADDRRRAERAVAGTVENIARLEPWPPTVEALINAAVPPAAVRVIAIDPVQFKVHAMTSWPDLMVYEYDSRAPGRGVQHYLF